jgi:DNA-binding XRE family transcriptional regulator
MGAIPTKRMMQMKDYNNFYDDFDTYDKFGFRDDYEEDPNDIMNIFNTRKIIMVHVDMLPLSQAIKAKRIIDGFNQRELAKILHMSVGTLSDIENGKRPIPKRRLKDVETWLYHMWYQDKVLIGIIEQGGE